jgi:serine/threonine-protein kinase RsbT
MTVAIRTPEELNSARRLVMEWATQLAFSIVERTKFVTAASELARNTLVHGLGGEMSIRELLEGARPGLQLEFRDQGPGISDIQRALADGYSTAKSLGLGLGGARRLVSEFEIISLPGQGTTITVTQWKRR